MKKIISIIIVILALLGGWYFFTNTPATTTSPSPSPSSTATGKEDLIQVSSPKANTVITSPLTVTGQARGTWYFEASFPVKVYDSTGKLLGSTPVQAQTDWMTTNFVPFKGTVIFSTPTTNVGTVVFEKDNPSGLPQNDNALVIPIRFK